MFHTMNYRGGFIQTSIIDGRETIRAHYCYQSAPVKSIHGAKCWIAARMRERAEQARRDAADHARAINDIWKR